MMDVRLVMFKRNGQRRDFPLQDGATIIGRGVECALRVPLLNVSREHCELAKGEGELRVKDLASSNGTYVNNQRVTEAALHAGDHLTVGPVVLTVQIDGVPEEITPAKTPAEIMAESSAPLLVEEDGDEIIELEADMMEPAQDDDSDPISALEALASEEEDEGLELLE